MYKRSVRGAAFSAGHCQLSLSFGPRVTSGAAFAAGSGSLGGSFVDPPNGSTSSRCASAAVSAGRYFCRPEVSHFIQNRMMFYIGLARWSRLQQRVPPRDIDSSDGFRTMACSDGFRQWEIFIQ
jgi:hypothetical protein